MIGMKKWPPIVLLALVVVVIFASVAFRVTIHHRSVSPITTTLAPVSYTNAITGEIAEDKPAESGSETPNPALTTATVAISGLQTLTNFLTDAQVANVQVSMTNFLMARSGLQSVSAGIKGNKIQRVNQQTITFELIAIKPQAAYQVTVYAVNQYQTVPTVTFKQVE